MDAQSSSFVASQQPMFALSHDVSEIRAAAECISPPPTRQRSKTLQQSASTVANHASRCWQSLPQPASGLVSFAGILHRSIILHFAGQGQPVIKCVQQDMASYHHDQELMEFAKYACCADSWPLWIHAAEFTSVGQVS